MPKEDSDKTSKTQIIVAVIGLIGLITVALIANVDKWWHKPNDNHIANTSNTSGGGAPSPDSTVSTAQGFSSSNCIEKDFAGAGRVNVNTNPRFQQKDTLAFVYVKKGIPIGVLDLVVIPSVQLDQVQFEVKKAVEVVGSQCREVKEFSNMEGPAGQKLKFWNNYNYLRIKFGNEYYKLRFQSDGKNVEAQILELPS
jgi:hypothetical protein